MRQSTIQIEDIDFLNEYKTLGYKTKSAMVNVALQILKDQELEAYREGLKRKMLNPDNNPKIKDAFFAAIEGDDFDGID